MRHGQWHPELRWRRLRLKQRRLRKRQCCQCLSAEAAPLRPEPTRRGCPLPPGPTVTTRPRPTRSCRTFWSARKKSHHDRRHLQSQMQCWWPWRCHCPQQWYLDGPSAGICSFYTGELASRGLAGPHVSSPMLLRFAPKMADMSNRRAAVQIAVRPGATWK